MTGRKTLIEITDLEQGGFKAQEVEMPTVDTVCDPIDGIAILKPIGEEIYAEKLPGKLGLINRIGKRLTEIFKP